MAWADTPAAKPAAEAKAPAAASSVGPLAGQFQQMIYMLNLSGDQKTQIKDQTDVMIKELEAFRLVAIKESKDAIAAIEPIPPGAERENLRRQLQDNTNKAMADYQNLITTHQAGISASLTANQRIIWETSKINHSLLARFGSKFSDAQKKQIKPMVDAAAKELAEAKDGGAPLLVNGKLIKRLMSEVLTEEQAGYTFLVGPPMLAGLGTIPGPKPASALPKPIPGDDLP